MPLKKLITENAKVMLKLFANIRDGIRDKINAMVTLHFAFDHFPILQ